MEDLKLKEKLLCAIKSNIQDFTENPYGTLSLYIPNSSPIYLYKSSIYKNEEVEKEVFSKSFFPWKKHNVKKVKVVEEFFSHYNYDASFGAISFTLSKEESQEIIELRKEKLTEKQVQTLDKLCKNK